MANPIPLGHLATLGLLGDLGRQGMWDFQFLRWTGSYPSCKGEPFVRFGEMDNRSSNRVERLHQTFMRAGVNAEIPPDIQVALI